MGRRLAASCMFCRRLMWWRRERYCKKCLNKARAIVAETSD